MLIRTHASNMAPAAEPVQTRRRNDWQVLARGHREVRSESGRVRCMFSSLALLYLLLRAHVHARICAPKRMRALINTDMHSQHAQCLVLGQSI